ncbi:integrase [Klebsiella pneumoniae]|uniref:Integrase n=1 Tax=Klebsiella pneumoniae TaxID=573 RepID=A0A2X3C5Z4_KLEPN|nr:integrase [Klebsiella pneumoniae]
MSKESYPTGVENHGKSLRIWFIFKGKRVRENLGVLTPLKQEGGWGSANVSMFCYPHGDL